PFPRGPDDWRGETEAEGLAWDDCAVVELAGQPAEAKFRGELPNVAEEEPKEWQSAAEWSEKAGVPVEQCLEEALMLVDDHWPAIEALARELVTREELDGPTAIEVIRPLLHRS
ncbi:MAG TPA: hypothetical protein VHG90_14575, partial [Acidimicrobiales bacterium]|nr:hypothetical protein [Acidimicrobiales bacterium]